MIDKKMINNLSQLRAILKNSSLESSDLAVLPIIGRSEQALAIKIEFKNAWESWQLMARKKEETLRVPVLVACWGNQNNCSWSENLHSSNFFDRFPFQSEVNRQPEENVSPRMIIERANHLDVQASLAGLSRQYEDDLDLRDLLETNLEETKQQFGQAPEITLLNQLIDSEELKYRLDLEKWLFNWEIKYCGEKATQSIDNSYLSWFEPTNEAMALLLIPTMNSWEIPAYLSWYGAETCTSELLIALLRYWNQKYGAELVAHYSTMLQLVVDRLPNSSSEALQLAYEQEVIAPCTTILPGVSLRNHARELLHSKQWFLHERP
jgi:hypothetical protein